MEYLEEPEDESLEDIEKIIIKPLVKPLKNIDEPKKKRVMSEKQLESLARGRMLGVQKLREKGAMTVKVKETHKQLEQVKQSEKIDSIEDLRKLNDLNHIRKSIDNMNDKFSSIDANFNNIHSKFDGYLSEREKRKQMKNENTIQKTIQKELPKTMNDLLYQQKYNDQIARNPYIGRV